MPEKAAARLQVQVDTKRARHGHEEIGCEGDGTGAATGDGDFGSDGGHIVGKRIVWRSRWPDVAQHYGLRSGPAVRTARP